MKFIYHIIKAFREDAKSYEDKQKLISRLFTDKEEEFRVFYQFWLEEVYKAENEMNKEDLSPEDVYIINQKRIVLLKYIDYMKGLSKLSQKVL